PEPARELRRFSVKPKVTILGAGFAGMELATQLSDEFADDIAVTLVNDSDAFVFGYSKLDVMFGRRTLEAVRLPYRRFLKPGVRFAQETVTAIDPHTRRVTTSAASYDADFLVVALGADYDFAATPGLRAGHDEFYSVEGACNCASACPGWCGAACGNWDLRGAL